MIWIEVLTEGSSDVPTVREILCRRFKLTENEHFRVHPHQGRGNLPSKPMTQPDPKNRSLLHQLPAKLRAYAKSLPEGSLVLVLVDADKTPFSELLQQLKDMHEALPQKPSVLFRIAVEETESWFLADPGAVKAAYPNANLKKIKSIAPDAVVGAWERLAEALGHEIKLISNSGVLKTQWAEKIAPHLNFDAPKSPSLVKVVEGLSRYLDENKVEGSS